LKPEQWGSPLVQEMYQEEKACDKRHPYSIIIIIIIIIIIVTSRNVRVFQLAKMISFYFHTKHEIAAIMQYSAHLLLRLTGSAKITAHA